MQHIGIFIQSKQWLITYRLLTVVKIYGIIQETSYDKSKNLN